MAHSQAFGFGYLFGSIWGGPKAPKHHKKNYFLVVLDYLSYKNGPNDLVTVRSLFSSLDNSKNIHLTCCHVMSCLFSISAVLEIPKMYVTSCSEGWLGQKGGQVRGEVGSEGRLG
jgi:hypothetical protein